MRVLFLVLVLANLAFFAWSRHTSNPPAPPYALQPSDSEELKMLSPRDLAPARPPSKPAPSACLEWGGFTVAELPRAEKALEPLGLGNRVATRRVEEKAGWWVFIPAQESRQAALKKAAELKALGVEDYFILSEEGEFRWALSLGVFRTEDAAHMRLAALRAAGVRSAVVGSRETVLPKLWMQVKGVDGVLESRLKEIARAVEGSELRACP